MDELISIVKQNAGMPGARMVDEAGMTRDEVFNPVMHVTDITAEIASASTDVIRWQLVASN